MVQKILNLQNYKTTLSSYKKIPNDPKALYIIKITTKS